jgi:uncharacterized damage-inducible protein DinB
MKDYFIRLFEYDAYANRLLINAMREHNTPEKSRSWMAHILGAQEIWLLRCKGEITGGPVWPDWHIDTFDEILTNNTHDWLTFLSEQKEGAWHKKITYTNSRGITFSDTLSDIIAHVINHGTHHRAQIGQDLKQHGAENLPVTDYIFYVREMNANH